MVLRLHYKMFGGNQKLAFLQNCACCTERIPSISSNFIPLDNIKHHFSFFLLKVHKANMLI